MLETVSVDQLQFKNKLSKIEQFSIKDLLFRWLDEPTEGLDDILPLEYSEGVYAKMEAKLLPGLPINRGEYFRYATITEANQIVIAVLDSNEELQHRIISLDELLVGKHL